MFSFSSIKKSGLIHENGDFIVHPTYDKIILLKIELSGGNNLTLKNKFLNLYLYLFHHLISLLINFHLFLIFQV